ncbi:nucleoside phosphorylase [Aquimarina hainanensis]|uniref:Uridine phosphorylase n=1 Tax=Aquimarina hainanensis TaxID=1578017 RepID=A0ABW5NCQ7_9FLAO
MIIPASELILNEDGSIYHLGIKPEHIAPTIITVGDPERVHQVTKYFDTITYTAQKREFHTQTGIYKGKKITVISTGIGTDNIDIVLNELDALVNIDLNTRTIKKQHTSLNIIRIGTSGAIQEDIPIDSFLISEMAIGFDNLLQFYKSEHVTNTEITDRLKEHLQWGSKKSDPYAVSYDKSLGNLLKNDEIINGITITNSGFYGPQGRILRLPTANNRINDLLQCFTFKNKRITNLEMETAGIYGLSKLLGHKAISMNAILANRVTKKFSNNPLETVNKLIAYTLEKITEIR